MKQIECVFEADVLSAVIQSRWPDRADPGLRDHAKTCAICADVAAVAGAIECVREETASCTALPDALPDSGRVWWKAQMRARREAECAAGRPITAVQVVAFACAMGLMGACIGATSGWFQSALKEVWAAAAGIDLQSLLSGHWILAACAAAVFFITPVALYLAIVKD